MLPFHRREGRREPAAATAEKPSQRGGSMWSRFFHFVINWLIVSWKDLLTMAILGAAALGVSCSNPRTRFDTLPTAPQPRQKPKD